MHSLLEKIIRVMAVGFTARHSDVSVERGRKRLFTLFVLLLVIFLVLFGIIHLIKGVYIFSILNFGATLVLGGFIIILRKINRGAILYRATIIMIGALFLYWIKTGAVHGYASIWVLTTPLFIFFLTGRREGLMWTAIITGATLVFFYNPFALLDVWIYPHDYIMRLVIALFIILVFTYAYESSREAFQSAIEREQGLLRMEKEHLATAKSEVDAINRRLRREMEVRREAEDEVRKHRDHLEDLVVDRTRELQRNNLELEESEKRYRLLADNVTDLIFSLGLNFKVIYISPSITSLYGYTPEEAKGLTMADVHTPESLDTVMRIFRDQMEIEKTRGADPERNIVAELVHRRKDGSLFDVEIRASFLRDESGIPVGIVGIARDISERVRAQHEKEKIQEQLAQAQKMEAIGTLVGGLAHDFNNILSGIMGSFDLLSLYLKKETLVEQEVIEKYLNVGFESTRRSVNLIKELLSLSRRHDIRPEPLDINEAVSHIYDICTNSFPKSIILSFEFAPGRPLMMGDMVQIGQVLLNLCINASHAMTIMRKPDEPQGGSLSVVVRTIDPESLPDLAGVPALTRDRPWVVICISDTGVGMDHETIMRMYEPFFTRKKRDEGSGLGLAISYNIIQRHGGLIRVDSEPGRGSSFTLYFPMCDDPGAAGRIGAGDDGLVRGAGMVLVIDDEHIVLNVVRGVLEQCGYTAITTDSPDAGIELYRERHREIAAVLIDLSMPGKSGLDVFRILKEINPGVRAILSSGMLDNESREKALALGIMGFANKPYLARELSAKIRDMLA